MKAFMDKDFLLETETAKHLFHDYAKDLPLVDYHCHIPPREIYENRRFDNLAQVWLGGKGEDGTYFGDHYKWRLMRAQGFTEDYVTGQQDGLERMRKFAQAVEMAIGNPMYHWCNLELRTFFDYDGYLSPDSVDEIWALANEKLQNDDTLTVRGLIERSNVAMIGTTDEPIDSLEWHEKIAADDSIAVKVLPSFRPDKVITIGSEGFLAYIDKLAACVGKASLDSVSDICDALTDRVAFFKAHGCAASDHGLDFIPYCPCTLEEAEAIYQKARSGESLCAQEAEKYQTYVLMHLARTYHKFDIAMQLHYSCGRNVNARIMAQTGPDTGFDMVGNTDCSANIAALLSALDVAGECPKTILYSLNPTDNAQLASLIGCFQSSDMPGKVQHGSAWWFNDTKIGMEEQMIMLASIGLLGNFIGMLTDSRSFLSYTRHDYFRRILCNLIGNWVENGEYPNDEKALKKLVEGICYKNAVRYFGL